MNDALTTTSYEGTFAHWQGGMVEMLRIIHRFQDGAVSERLMSLDGGREFIRTGATLTCYLPDQRTVLVESRSPQDSLLSFPQVNDQTARFYDIKEEARARWNLHDTHVITVSPKDDYRYGYRVWVDDPTAMPLQTQLRDSHGRIIEQIVFVNFSREAHIPDVAFKPRVSADGFQVLRSDAVRKGPVAESGLVWSAPKLPPGFRMTAHAAQILPGLTDPVDHMVFSDGLASVSVFVEVYTRAPSSASDVPVAQSARVGSSSAFSMIIDGHKITAVGEVPPVTVRFIASSVKVQGGGSASSSATEAHR
jgi:sigma-E factor negative regulatory protein RseB